MAGVAGAPHRVRGQIDAYCSTQFFEADWEWAYNPCNPFVAKLSTDPRFAAWPAEHQTSVGALCRAGQVDGTKKTEPTATWLYRSPVPGWTVQDFLVLSRYQIEDEPGHPADFWARQGEVMGQLVRATEAEREALLSLYLLEYA